MAITSLIDEQNEPDVRLKEALALRPWERQFSHVHDKVSRFLADETSYGLSTDCISHTVNTLTQEFKRRAPKTAAYLGLAKEHWLKPTLAGFNRWASAEEWAKWRKKTGQNIGDHVYNNRKRYYAAAGILLLAGGLASYFSTQSDSNIIEPEAEPVAEFGADPKTETTESRPSLCDMVINMAGGIDAAKAAIDAEETARSRGESVLVPVPGSVRNCVAGLTLE